MLPHFLARGDSQLAGFAADCTLRRPLWLAIHTEVRRSPRVAWVSAAIGAAIGDAAAELA